MSDRSRSRSANHWLDLATGDLAGAKVVVADPTLSPRLGAGLAAQAAEKALKAVLASSGVEPPRTHDLVALAHRVRSVLQLSVSEDDLRSLTDAHEQARYPDPDEATFDTEESTDLVHIADVIVHEAIAAFEAS